MQVYQFRDSIKITNQHSTVEIPMGQVKNVTGEILKIYKADLIDQCTKGAPSFFCSGRSLEIFIEGLQEKSIEELEEIAQAQATIATIAQMCTDEKFNPSKH